MVTSKKSRISAWESDSRNRFWTFLICPKLKSPLRLSEKHRREHKKKLSSQTFLKKKKL